MTQETHTCTRKGRVHAHPCLRVLLLLLFAMTRPPLVLSLDGVRSIAAAAAATTTPASVTPAISSNVFPRSPHLHLPLLLTLPHSLPISGVSFPPSPSLSSISRRGTRCARSHPRDGKESEDIRCPRIAHSVRSRNGLQSRCPFPEREASEGDDS